MKVAKKISLGGEYAKIGEDIKDGDVIIIKDSGTEVEGDYGVRVVFKVATDNGEKNLSFNQTSMNNVIDAYGDDTEKWIDKEIQCWVVKQMVSKKLRNIAYLAGKGWTMLEDGQFVEKTGGDTLNDIEYPEEK